MSLEAPPQRSDLERLVAAARGQWTAWGDDLPALLEWIADRRDADAARENVTECVAPKLRDMARELREALKPYAEVIPVVK